MQYLVIFTTFLYHTKGSFQKRFSGFFPLRGYPPPLNGKLPKIFLKKWVKKG